MLLNYNKPVQVSLYTCGSFSPILLLDEDIKPIGVQEPTRRWVSSTDLGEKYYPFK
jgi:hypothetical protein